jgi:hypothetical protein
VRGLKLIILEGEQAKDPIVGETKSFKSAVYGEIKVFAD